MFEIEDQLEETELDDLEDDELEDEEEESDPDPVAVLTAQVQQLTNVVQALAGHVQKPKEDAAPEQDAVAAFTAEVTAKVKNELIADRRHEEAKANYQRIARGSKDAEEAILELIKDMPVEQSDKLLTNPQVLKMLDAQRPTSKAAARSRYYDDPVEPDNKGGNEVDRQVKALAESMGIKYDAKKGKR
jgi:polyribonucleotide nucleotidyltransferase